MTVDVIDAVPRNGVAVILPGFLDSVDYSSYTALGQALPAIAVAAVRYDLLGSWTNPAHCADYTPTLHLSELSSVIDEIVASGAKRVILIGFCYGAQLAVLQAADDRRVTDVVALMPTTSFIWPEEYDERKDTWRSTGTCTFQRGHPVTRTLTGSAIPYSSVEDARKYRIHDSLDDLSQRILFIAGQEDLFIRPSTVERLYERCGSQDKRLEVLEGVQHDYRDHPGQIKNVNETVLNWLRRG